MHARELGILVDGEGAPCVGVPAGSARGRPGGRARDVDGYGSDGFDLHDLSLLASSESAESISHRKLIGIGRMHGDCAQDGPSPRGSRGLVVGYGMLLRI